MAHAGGLILLVTAVLNGLVYAFVDPILTFLKVPEELLGGMRSYLLIIFAGLLATSVYNFFACLLRALGNSVAPLWFLGVSALLNIGLDLLFVLEFHWGIAGAAWATVLAQYVSGVGILVYCLIKCREFLPEKQHFRYEKFILQEIWDLSALTCLQQSAMNFGILLIQRLVDSFGPVTMAAFAAAVKIDTFAYLPVQDFGNAFSTFAAQNYGAGNKKRLAQGLKTATILSWRLFLDHFGSGLGVCAESDGHFHQGRGNGGHCLRRGLSAAGGSVLRPDRLPVPAVRLLSGGEKAWNVCGSDGHFSGAAGSAGLCPFADAGGKRHLDGHSHRLGRCGRYRLRLVFSSEKGPSAQSGRAVNVRFSPFQGKVMR